MEVNRAGHGAASKLSYTTLKLFDWFNYRRLLEPIGIIPLTEAKNQYHAAADNIDMAA